MQQAECQRKHSIQDRSQNQQSRARNSTKYGTTRTDRPTDRLTTAPNAQRAGLLMSAWVNGLVDRLSVSKKVRSGSTIAIDLETSRRLGYSSLLCRAPVSRPVTSTISTTTTCRRRGELERRRKRRRWRFCSDQSRRFHHFTL